MVQEHRNAEARVVVSQERYERAVDAAEERLRALAEAIVIAPAMPGDASLRVLARLMVQAIRGELES